MPRANHTPEQALGNLADRLPRVAPYLFRLADQLCAQESDRWNLMLVDDISGRLPGFFIRRVLSENGIKIPTRFVAGSKTTQTALGQSEYATYFASLRDSLGERRLRPLFFTESIGSGDTANFMREALSPISELVEIATVSNRFPQQNYPEYCGGHGQQAATEIFFAFESLAGSSRKGRIASSVRRAIPQQLKDALPAKYKPPVAQSPTNLLNIAAPSDTKGLPVSVRRSGEHRTLEAYSLMENLANRYLAEHKNDSTFGEPA